MSKLKMLILVLVTGVIAYGTTFAQKAQTIAVVDYEQISNNWTEAIDAKKVFSDLNKTLSDSLAKMQDDFQKRVDSYQKQQGMMQPDQKTKEENSLRALQETIMNARQTMSNDLEKRREEILLPIKNKISDAVNAVAQAEGIGVVLLKGESTVLYSSPEFDITFKVLEKLRVMSIKK